jgi:hypothetical protein
MSSSLRSEAHDKSHDRITEQVERGVATFAEDAVAEARETGDEPSSPPIGQAGPPGRPMAARPPPGLDRIHSGRPWGACRVGGESGPETAERRGSCRCRGRHEPLLHSH